MGTELLPFIRPLGATLEPHNNRNEEVRIITFTMIPHLSFRKTKVLNLKVFLVGVPPTRVSLGYTLFF